METVPKSYWKVKFIDSRLYEWQAWLLTSHPTFSDLLQVQQGLGAAQVSFAGAGAWKTSQKLWGLFAQKDNGLLQSYKFLKRKMRIRMLGVKGFRFWPSPHLKGRTATNQQRVQRWLPQCHCDNWPLFSLPSDQNYPAPKRRRSNKVRPQQRHIISQKPPPTDRTFSGQK